MTIKFSNGLEMASIQVQNIFIAICFFPYSRCNASILEPPKHRLISQTKTNVKKRNGGIALRQKCKTTNKNQKKCACIVWYHIKTWPSNISTLTIPSHSHLLSTRLRAPRITPTSSLGRLVCRVRKDSLSLSPESLSS
jgi:hypothetical protein